MATSLKPAELLALLHSAEVILTPSARAAATLRERHNQQQRAAGRAAWRPANVHSWTDWLGSLWSRLLLDGAEGRVLLNHLQEEMLWSNVLTHSPLLVDRSPAAVRDLVSLSQAAFQLAASFHLLGRLKQAADGPDTRAFAEWQIQFSDLCRERRVLAPALLEAAVVEHLTARTLPAPKTLHLVGFDHLSPAQHAVLHALEQVGVSVDVHALSAAGAERFKGLIRLPTPEAQYRWAASWLRGQLGQHEEGSPSLALVLLATRTERQVINTMLRQELAPDLQDVGTDLDGAPWSYATGPVLETELVIRHALLLLHWLETPLLPEQVTSILLSPYLLSDVDLEVRAQFDARLRSVPGLRPERSLDSFLDHVQQQQCAFLELESVYAERSKAGARLRTYADWAEYTRRLLRKAGWPGTRSLSLGEETSIQAWDKLLDLLSTMDLLAPQISFSEFLTQLEHQAMSLVVPASTPTAPIQILSLQEAEGCLFDAVLLLDATDQHLPPPERPHPFIGWALQRQHGLPGTSSQAACRDARDALESLAQRSGTILFASPEADTTGPLRPSSIPADIGCVLLNPDNLVEPTPGSVPVSLEWVADDLDLPPLPSQQVAGGARVLELQAACGFRAFAALRLTASSVENTGVGLDARRSGNVLHRAMDAFWAEVKSQDALRELSAGGRSAAISRAVAKALAPWRRFTERDSWASAYVEVLEQRFRQILWAWLDRELSRAPFSVQEREQEKLVQIGSLELKVRPDRIDQSAEGLVFIDYKSSQKLHVDDWLGERPHLPQLPLYALLYPADQVRGVAFARLRAGKSMGWIPLQSEAGVFPKGPVVNLETQHELWKEELDRLAAGFASGDTRVSPKEYPNTCTWCDFRLLCRVDPKILMKDEDRPPAGEGLHG